MKLSNLLSGVVVSCLCAAGCADAESDLASSDDNVVSAQQASAAIDMTGTWFTKVKTKATVTAPIVGAATADTDLALKLFVRKDGSKLTADVAVCNLATNSPSLTLNLDKVEPFIKLTESIADFTPSIGGKVPLPEVNFLIGQDATGAAVDIDGDGQKGGTFAVTALGLVPFDAYAGFSLKIAMDAKLADAQTVSGTATFSGAGTIFGSNFPLLTSGTFTVAQAVTPLPFTAKRYAGDVPCAELLAKP